MPSFRRIAAAFAVLLSATAAHAQSTDLNGIAHVAIRVHDLAASVAFYEKLGFVKAFELSRDGRVYEAFIKINDRQFIELYPADEKNPQIGFLHLCFEGADLQSVHDFYVAQGLPPNAVRTAGAGNLLFTMPGPATPQGPQNLEYTQYMPGSLHSKDFGKNIGPNRISDHLTSVTVATEDPAAAKKFYIDKMGFKPAYKPLLSFVSLPGSRKFEDVVLVDTQQGFKASIEFGLGSTSPKKAESTLKSRDIAFTKDALGDPLLIDPDGNEIHLRGPHIF
jgi:catechol 2,3-dioxygenase-like lactoylglutathione lyase family enzyme